MADEEKVYKPVVIQDQPFPDEPELAPTQEAGSSGVFTPEKIKDKPLPSKRIAHELIGPALNTQSRKILSEFQFTPSGALQIGQYENGVSGDIRISPRGIVARNSSGITTFAIDGETGDATFLGTIQAGSVIANTIISASEFTGEITVGGEGNDNGAIHVLDGADVERITIDKDGIVINQGKITIKDANDTTIIDSTGLVSTANFANGSVTDSNAFTTTSDSFVDVTNMTLTFTLARTSNVLIGASVVGRNDDSDTSNARSAITQIVADGGAIGGYMVTPGIGTGGGVGNTTGATSIIISLAAGSHTIKLQAMRGNGGTARLVTSNPKTLWYVVLGK